MVISIVSQCLGFCLLRRHRMASLMVILSHTFSLTHDALALTQPSQACPATIGIRLGQKPLAHLSQGPCGER